MKNLVKYGLIAVGGYLAYSWYKKNKSSSPQSSTEELPTNEMGMPIVREDIEKPLSAQSDEEIRGDGLTIKEKEAYIVANGDIPILEQGDSTFFNADGQTDDAIMEAAMAEEEGEEGFGIIASELKAKDILEDAKCGFKSLKNKFRDAEYNEIEKDHINSLFVLVKCRQAQRKGEMGCENLPVVQEAAAKRRKLSKRLKAKNPTAVKAIMRRCLREGKKKRATRNPFNTSVSMTKRPMSISAMMGGSKYKSADGLDIRQIHNIHHRRGKMLNADGDRYGENIYGQGACSSPDDSKCSSYCEEQNGTFDTNNRKCYINGIAYTGGIFGGSRNKMKR
jgi:hypothetical protein